MQRLIDSRIWLSTETRGDDARGRRPGRELDERHCSSGARPGPIGGVSVRVRLHPTDEVVDGHLTLDPLSLLQSVSGAVQWLTIEGPGRLRAGAWTRCVEWS